MKWLRWHVQVSPRGSLGSCGRTALTPWGAGARTNSLASGGQRHRVQRSSALQYSAAFINLGMCESPGKLSTTACGFTVTIANYWQLSGDTPNLLFFLFLFNNLCFIDQNRKMHQTIDHRAALHVPLFQQLVSKHPADSWCRVTRGHTGQQHAGIRHLGHRHRLHQEFQLPLLSSFLDVKGKKRGQG